MPAQVLAGGGADPAVVQVVAAATAQVVGRVVKGGVIAAAVVWKEPMNILFARRAIVFICFAIYRFSLEINFFSAKWQKCKMMLINP